MLPTMKQYYENMKTLFLNINLDPSKIEVKEYKGHTVFNIDKKLVFKISLDKKRLNSLAEQKFPLIEYAKNNTVSEHKDFMDVVFVSSAFINISELESLGFSPKKIKNSLQYAIYVTHPNELINNKAYQNMLKIIYENISAMYNSIDCCSRYMECSNQKKCISPYQDISLACTYRKKLVKGLIYYGKNRNI